MNRVDDLKYLVNYLVEERFGKNSAYLGSSGESDDEDRLFEEFRALVNTRPPEPAGAEFLAVQDRVLRGRIEEAGITSAADLDRVPSDNRLSLWRGDITTLDVETIVNAANSQMLGCWIPGHYCIDNAIHTFSGVQLRIECARIMGDQGHDEPTGEAKMTDAFNLPSRFIIHTVGPIANGHPSKQDAHFLAKSYLSCLEAAAERGCKSIAFCCISTGVFGFPQEEAARIAVDTVRMWLDENQSDMHVVFNVFGEKDERIYHELLFD